MTKQSLTIEEQVERLDHDLQLETDFRLSARQRAQLVLTHHVVVSHANFAPFAQRAHHYLAVTSEDDRGWYCLQDLSSLNYIIYLLQ